MNGLFGIKGCVFLHIRKYMNECIDCVMSNSNLINMNLDEIYLVDLSPVINILCDKE